MVNTFAAVAGFYELGEIRRLRGDLDGALAAFGQARSLGTDPQPGEALVWTRQGDTGAARTALQASLAWQDRIGRAAHARGATNRQVAEQLFISDKTAGRYLANIYTKLGVSSRTAAVSWAYANKVVDSAGRFAE